MKEALKQFAQEVGFEAVGVSRPNPETWLRFRAWLAEGRHGEMHYMERRAQDRQDPSLVLGAPAGSVIVLAKNYWTGHAPHRETDRRAGIVSCYAWGDDYHDVLAEGAQRVCEWIAVKTEGRHRARWCVDTAPVLERDFAAQAGIGWIGKHTNVIHRRLGNWIFLAVIITTLELEPDEPSPAHCGTCRQCLDRCPTGAILAPYVLDARRCISYLTIELKGPIPLPLRPLLGIRIFGCDDCLAACPWNRFAVRSREAAFQPRPFWKTTDLLRLMRLTDAEFRAEFQNSPIRRVKRRGLLRNVAVALGNLEDPAALPVLAEAMDDREPLVRGHAAWAIGRIPTAESRDLLLRFDETETDPSVRQEIAWAVAWASCP